MNSDKGAGVIFALVVWGMAGALFGSLFAGLHQVLQVVGLQGWPQLVVAAGAAAMTTSAFYSSMPVALVGAMAGVVASLGYLMTAGHQVKLLYLAAVAAIAGLVAGGLYAWLGKGGLRPLAQTVAGLFSGLIASGLLILGLELADAEIGMFALAAVIVALVGSIFQLFRRWILSTSSVWCPRTLSAPLVAGLIAAVVGASVWVMGGITASSLDPETKGSIDEVLHRIPSGLFGGMLGGAVTGLFLALLGVQIEDS